MQTLWEAGVEHVCVRHSQVRYDTSHKVGEQMPTNSTLLNTAVRLTKIFTNTWLLFNTTLELGLFFLVQKDKLRLLHQVLFTVQNPSRLLHFSHSGTQKGSNDGLK